MTIDHYSSLLQIYSNGIWQALLTTRRGNCGKHMTKNKANGLKSRHAPSHAIMNHVGMNAILSNIIYAIRRTVRLSQYIIITLYLIGNRDSLNN